MNGLSLSANVIIFPQRFRLTRFQLPLRWRCRGLPYREEIAGALVAGKVTCKSLQKPLAQCGKAFAASGKRE